MVMGTGVVWSWCFFKMAVSSRGSFEVVMSEARSRSFVVGSVGFGMMFCLPFLLYRNCPADWIRVFRSWGLVMNAAISSELVKRDSS